MSTPEKKEFIHDNDPNGIYGASWVIHNSVINPSEDTDLTDKVYKIITNKDGGKIFNIKKPESPIELGEPTGNETLTRRVRVSVPIMKDDTQKNLEAMIPVSLIIGIASGLNIKPNQTIKTKTCDDGNNDTDNCQYDNLVIVNKKETTSTGKRGKARKVSKETVIEIRNRNMLSNGKLSKLAIDDMVDEFGLSAATINNIRVGKIYEDYGGPIAVNKWIHSDTLLEYKIEKH